MRRKLIFLLLVSTLFSFGQTTKKLPLKTSIYSGVYSFGDIRKNYGGNVIVYAETDSTILFYIDIYTGNIGQRYCRLKVQNGKGVYYSKEDSDEKGCKWLITIIDKTLTIKTIDKCYECEFGGNVIADNKYILKRDTKPEYFIDGHGHKIFFNKTKPENYLR